MAFTQDKKDETADQTMMRRNPSRSSSADPLFQFRHLADQMDRWMFGQPFPTRSLWSAQQLSGSWTPQIETLQRDGQFVVRADLPGLKPSDVTVDIADDGLTIQGTRKEEHEEPHDGFYTTERSYGSFYRVVPLPEGAIAHDAKATFRNGVLEIVMPAPPKEVTRGRRLEISDTDESAR